MDKLFLDKVYEDDLISHLIPNMLKRLHYRLPSSLAYSRLMYKIISHDHSSLTDLISVTELSYFLMGWELKPGRIYTVSPDTALLLLHTNLDVQTDIFRLPFDHIIVEVPDNVLFNYEGKSISILYISMDHTEEGDELVILAGLKDNVQSVLKIRLRMYGFEKISGSLEAFFKQTRKRDNEKMKEITKNGGFKYLDDWEWNEHDEDVHRAILQFALNTVLYITSSDNDIRKEVNNKKSLEKKLRKHPEKRTSIQERLKKASRFPCRYVVGESIRLSDQERDMFNRIAHSKHRFRYPVSGHWRNQWYGSMDARYQKHIWIRPHFRGPEIADIIRTIGEIK